jgi:sterol desaturase/sphingolipid hydroxylase (fatty acid hydroxylase superfamily)
MIAGIIGWVTLTFWAFNNMYLISDNIINFSSHNIVITIRNFIGFIVAGLSIAASHNLFHKIRMLGK